MTEATGGCRGRDRWRGGARAEEIGNRGGGRAVGAGERSQEREEDSEGECGNWQGTRGRGGGGRRRGEGTGTCMLSPRIFVPSGGPSKERRMAFFKGGASRRFGSPGRAVPGRPREVGGRPEEVEGRVSQGMAG